MKKNTASQLIGAQMVNAADGTAFTGSASVAVTVDGGTQGAGGGTGPTHEGNGFHTYLPTQAETNGDHVAFTFTGTGAIPVTVQVYTTFPQTGDNYARLGAPAGASIAADIATVDTVVDTILVDTAELQTDWTDGGRLDLILDAVLVDTAEIGTAGAGLTAVPWNAAWDAEVQSEVNDGLVALGLDHLVAAAVIGTDITDNSIIAKLVSSSATADWDSYVNTTDSLQAVRDRGDAAWTTATSVTVSDKTGFSLASTGLDLVTAWTTNITGSLSGSVGSVTGAVGSVTGAVGSVTAATTVGTINDGAVGAAVVADIFSTTTIAEAYAADGAAGTPAQILYLILSALTEFSIASTTVTCKKLDGSTTAATYTLDSATVPTSRTRAT